MDQVTDWHTVAASTLEWWDTAGVDTLVEDTPRDWLTPAPAPVANREPVTPAADNAPAPVPAMPDTIEAFVRWRTSEHAPERSWNAPLLTPRLIADAKLLIFTDMPEAEDAEEGRLLGGAPGRLFDRMLAAIGLSRDEIALSGIALARPASGQIAREDERALRALALHQLVLTTPKRVLLLGQAASRALIAPERAGLRGSLEAINHQGRKYEAIATFHPRFLLQRPAAKGESWKDLQRLMGGIDS
ncbi:DNA polymerase [Stakelama sediminis]|uniref:DNA polymerase n=1 Tax=Stakelama sediminis TaxID=463200 RepID=A0A840YYZ2_9SPHN|nr:DNA polymerase [Stakelama sediminis]